MNNEKLWTKEEFAEWIRDHIGEYVISKAKVHKKLREMATVEFNAMFAKEINALSRVDSRGISHKSDAEMNDIYESMIALTAIMPSEERGDAYTAVVESIEDWTWAIERTTEDARHVIERMVKAVAK